MREETVKRVIDVISLENQDLRKVLGMVYMSARDCVDKWPENATGMISRRMLKATGMLIHQRINSEEIKTLGKEYWQSENGKKVERALSCFVDTRTKRAEERKEFQS